MAAAYCYEGIPLRFLASLFDIQMRYLVYMRYLWDGPTKSKQLWYKNCIYGHKVSFRSTITALQLRIDTPLTNLVPSARDPLSRGSKGSGVIHCCFFHLSALCIF